MATQIPNEKDLLEGLDAFGAHADELPNAGTSVFAYRAFDLRDRFPMPFPSVRRALEALQSDTAYLPGQFGEILAYLHNGTSLTIPRRLYTREVARFRSEADATDWLESADQVSPELRELRFQVVDFEAPQDIKIRQALELRESEIVSAEHNETVCSAVQEWLNNQ